MVVKKSRIKRILAFLIGLLAVQNVIYVFKISNTYIDIELFLGFAALFFLLIIDNRSVVEALKNTDRSLKWYLLSIGFSLVYLINYSVFNSGTRVISFLNGLISLFLSLSVYYCVIILRRYRMLIVKGLWIGLVINTFVSLLQLVMFNAGSYFSLYDYFPEDFYYVSIKWGVPGTVHLSEIQEWLIYSYRASGLYLECSYFVASMTSVLIFCWSYRKRKITDYIILIILTILIMMSGSGNFIIYITMLTFYFMYRFLNNLKKSGDFALSKKYAFMIFLVIVGVIIIALVFDEKTLDLSKVDKGIEDSISGFNAHDSGNNERLTFMIAAFHLYLTYPVGVGYNMASNALRAYSSTYAAFNYLLTVLIEIGPVGLIAYLNLWYRNIIGVIKKVEMPKKAIFIGLISMIMFQIANGTGFTPIVWVLLGITKAERMEKNICIAEAERMEKNICIAEVERMDKINCIAGINK